MLFGFKRIVNGSLPKVTSPQGKNPYFFRLAFGAGQGWGSEGWRKKRKKVSALLLEPRLQTGSCCY
jgi:hypothetical protein